MGREGQMSRLQNSRSDSLRSPRRRDMPDGHFSRDGRRRLLLVALGRQRVGKSAVLNTVVQYFRAGGSEVVVWNADQHNRTHSLSTFFPDASLPPEGGLMDTRGW